MERKFERKVMNPFLDWSFKYLFATEGSKANLIGILNVLLSPEPEIVEVDIMNSESIPVSQELKGCVFDILCKDEAGDLYLIELQNQQMMNEADRIIYYTCRLIDRMGKRGKEWDYTQIKRVYSICLMNFTYEETPVLRRDVVLYDIIGKKPFSDKLNIILLQIPCLKATSIHDCSLKYEFFVYLLKEMNKGMKTIDELKQEVAETGLSESTKEIFYKVLDTADVASLSEQDRMQYESDLKSYRDTMGCIKFAEMRGEKDGRMNEKLDIARNMKAKGCSTDLIASCTGLSDAEISEL